MQNISKIRNDFPVYANYPSDQPLVYLDSTATTLKPRSVISALDDYYLNYPANVFRGIYKMSEKATAMYEKSRTKIARFIGAQDPKEIIFTRNASESLNLFYYSWAVNNLAKDDEIVTTIMEHHSNFVPWQQMCISKRINLKIWYTDNEGQLKFEDLNKLITRKTKLLSITAASNVLGILVDIRKVVNIVKKINPEIVVLVDAAQYVPHLPVDVSSLGADFIAFSGHKMLGPTGIGVLWGRKSILEQMPPFQMGGDMIREVHEKTTVFNEIPHKFEAGTPHIAGAIGLGAAVSYLENLGMDQVRKHEQELVEYAMDKMDQVRNLTIYGPKKSADRVGVISFSIKGIHPHDIAQILDTDNICIRVGFHCAQPLHEFIGCGPTARASFYIYNTKDDVDALIIGLEKVKKIFA